MSIVIVTTLKQYRAPGVDRITWPPMPEPPPGDDAIAALAEIVKKAASDMRAVFDRSDHVRVDCSVSFRPDTTIEIR